jgi:tetraacyldisaccharide 4'-kinase
MHVTEAIYHFGLSVKKFRAFKNRKRLPGKVISIGNLTVGGTGKTPATIAVAGEALKRGLCPIILTRGYGGKAPGPCFVTRGDGPHLSAEGAGDEPALMAERLSGVPVVKGRNRYEAGIFALRELSRGIKTIPEDKLIFILDDGFQHWSLYRDVDILLLDCANPFGNGLLLPLGRLREPVSAVSRADIVVLTRTGSRGKETCDVEKTMRQIGQYKPGMPVFTSEHTPVSCRLVTGSTEPFSFLSGRKVFGFCGIANPGAFRDTLLSGGAELTGFRPFRDHYRYRQKDVDAIAGEAERAGAVWIATTEKDIMKTRELALPGNILIIEIAFFTADSFYETIFR